MGASRFAIPALSVFAFLAIAFMSLFSLREEFATDRSELRASGLWLATEVERQYLRFNDVVQRFALDDPSLSVEDLTLRFDILWSQVDILGQGPLGRHVIEISDSRLELETLQALLADIDAALAAYVETSTPFDAALIARIEQHTDMVHQIALKVDKAEQTFLLNQADGVTRSLRNLAFLIIGMALSGALLILIVLKETRRAKGARERTARAEKEVRELNASLEGRILERTLELDLARRAAEDANSAKTKFLASMSHELRTPLNAILGFSQLLALNTNKTLTEKQLEYIQDVHQSGTHLLRLVDDILDLAFVESGRLTIFPTTADALTLVQKSIDILAQEAKNAGITVSFNRPTGPLKDINTDPTRFQQILFNILSNAIKFSSSGGTIQVEGSIRDQQFLRISVSDTGCGIPLQKQARIFSLFYRGVDQPEIAQGGRGIGLSVSKMLAERMGGYIGFESEPGAGSTFWVEAPLASNECALVWSEHLRTGFDALDAGLQTLFVLNNAVMRADLSEEDCLTAHNKLIEASRLHFRREEAMMDAIDYPNADTHRHDHDAALKRLEALGTGRRACTANQNALHEIRRDSRAWWLAHIRDHDIPLGRAANGRETDIAKALANLPALSSA